MSFMDFHTALQRRLESILGMSPQIYATPKVATIAAQPSSGDKSFDSFMRAIAGQESGGNYSAKNPSGALGKYQILGSNLGREAKSGWDFEALGQDITPSQFLSSPELQEKIASYKLKQYYDAYGAAGAAVAWYAGPGAVKKLSNSTKPQNGYPSIVAYKNAILRRMGLL